MEELIEIMDRLQIPAELLLCIVHRRWQTVGPIVGCRPSISPHEARLVEGLNHQKTSAPSQVNGQSFSFSPCLKLQEEAQDLPKDREAAGSDQHRCSEQAKSAPVKPALPKLLPECDRSCLASAQPCLPLIRPGRNHREVPGVDGGSR